MVLTRRLSDMIRIIAGIYKGRFLKIPDSSVTRPTMDKVRQAIFNALKDKTQGSVCVDLFAGSGAMGLEALSRGAKQVYFNDKDRKTFQVMKENILSLKPSEDCYVMALSDYRLFLKKYSDIKFDLVFLDPPYRFNINSVIIEEMVERNMLNDDAVIVSEQEKENPEIEGFAMKEYKYGQKHVAIYRKA